MTCNWVRRYARDCPVRMEGDHSDQPMRRDGPTSCFGLVLNATATWCRFIGRRCSRFGLFPDIECFLWYEHDNANGAPDWPVGQRRRVGSFACAHAATFVPRQLSPSRMILCWRQEPDLFLFSAYLYNFLAGSYNRIQVDIAF